MTHVVALIAFPGVQILDVTGPAAVFAAANACGAGRGAYAVRVVAAQEGLLRSSSGLDLWAHGGWTAVSECATALVAGGPGVEAAARDEELRRWLRSRAGSGTRVGSVCSGAFVLAAAGLLTGRKVATHWQASQSLVERHPDIEVLNDRMYVCDGGVWTSAGVTAGVDMALALVEQDHGSDVALGVARQLVVPLSRPGGQSQYSAMLTTGLSGTFPIRKVQRWVARHPAADCSVGALARQAAMSERHFQRRFAAEVGTPPGVYVEQVRTDVARRLLESTDATLAQIAKASGLGTVATLQRAFRRRLGTTPSDYRAAFAGSLR